MSKLHLMLCPGCQVQSEVESIFTIKVGDRFDCACGKSLAVKLLGNPLQMEAVVPPKSYSLKEKKQ